MRFLKKNTAVRITVGPFLDYSDGVTPETALTVTNSTCTVTLDDDDGTGVNTILNTTLTASGGNNDMVHVANGLYDLELTAAQTNYNGRYFISITDPDVHCPVFHEFMILPANVYNSLVSGSDSLEVDATAISGSTTAADNAEVVYDTDFATNYNTTTDKWQTEADVTDWNGTGLGVTDQLDEIHAKLPSKSYLTGTANADGDVEADGMTGNFGGSVASVVGAVGSVTGNVGGNVTGSVGSVTGNVGGNVVGSVASVTGAINTAAGTITTLDALDTAQDTQHSTTQTSLGTVDSNVTTLLTSVAAIAGKFTGITLLAEWLGAMAGKQTANATALSEINATGAGSGTFAGGAADSLEGIRDHIGDGTNLTEAGGDGDHLTAVIGADGDTHKTLSDQLDGLAPGSAVNVTVENTDVSIEG